MTNVIYQKALCVCVCVCAHGSDFFLCFLGLLFVRHFWLATNSFQIYHPFLQFLKANWLMNNLQGVCFVKLMFCMHKKNPPKSLWLLWNCHYLIHLHVFTNPQNTFPIFRRQSIKLTYWLHIYSNTARRWKKELTTKCSLKTLEVTTSLLDSLQFASNIKSRGWKKMFLDCLLVYKKTNMIYTKKKKKKKRWSYDATSLFECPLPHPHSQQPISPLHSSLGPFHPLPLSPPPPPPLPPSRLQPAPLTHVLLGSVPLHAMLNHRGCDLLCVLIICDGWGCFVFST